MHDVSEERARELPPTSITFSDMSWNRTGSWRYLRPKFVRKFSPCSEACPAGNDIAGFMMLAGEGRYSEALSKILEESPLPGVCGRVCYHPCEAACNGSVLHDPVSIQGIERFISDHAPDVGPTVGPARTERVCVVGSGPAGLTCAYHLRRLGYDVTIFEKERALGGVLRLGIPDYRLPRDVLDREIDRILSLGINAQEGCRAGQDIAWEELFTWDALFLGVGAHGATSWQIEGATSEGVFSGTQFLRAINLGDPVKPGGRVAIIGGGNTAIDCARAALRLGSRPTIIYRRTREEMPAIEAEIEEACDEGIALQWLTSPVAIRAIDGRVVELECVKNRLGDPDESGRREPEPIPGSGFSVPVDSVITAIGETVDPDSLPPGLKLDRGVVEIDSWGKTSIEKIWAGGDTAADPRMVVHAIAAGKRAALSIHAHFRGEDLSEIGERIGIGAKGSFSMQRYLEGDPEGAPSVQEVVRPENINLDHFEPMERVKLLRKAPSERVDDFQEVNPGYDEENARQEASRCFHCGTCDLCGICYRFCPDLSVLLGDRPGMNRLDGDHCKGCGICAQECPRGAIVMERG